MKILYYGNCQTGALKSILEKPFSSYNANYVIIECWNTDINENDFLNHIKTSDIIFTQPISDNYRDKHYLSTNYILSKAKQETKIFIFPSIYFDFYYIDQDYKWKNGESLQEPSPYHYNKIIETFNLNQDKNYYMNMYLNNKNLINKTDLIKRANNSILKLKERENSMKEYIYKHKNTIILTISEYIEVWYKKALLFYSVNHPTNHVFHYLCHKILPIFNLSFNAVDTSIDPLHRSDRGILYKCVQEVVEFDINNYKPNITKYNIQNIDEFIEMYFMHYRKPENKKFLT